LTHEEMPVGRKFGPYVRPAGGLHSGDNDGLAGAGFEGATIQGVASGGPGLGIRKILKP
jgi:hypothetical protein